MRKISVELALLLEVGAVIEMAASVRSIVLANTGQSASRTRAQWAVG